MKNIIFDSEMAQIRTVSDNFKINFCCNKVPNLKLLNTGAIQNAKYHYKIELINFFAFPSSLKRQNLFWELMGPPGCSLLNQLFQLNYFAQASDFYQSMISKMYEVK